VLMKLLFLTQPNIRIIQTFVEVFFLDDLKDMSIHVRKTSRLSSVINGENRTSFKLWDVPLQVASRVRNTLREGFVSADGVHRRIIGIRYPGDGVIVAFRCRRELVLTMSPRVLSVG